MQKVLFICSRNRLRSPTAEAIFGSYPELEVESAGLSADAENPVTPESLEGVDIVFVMEKVHRTRLARKFQKYLRGCRIVCLDIPDNYDYMDSELVRLLEERVTPHLNASALATSEESDTL